MPSSLLIDFEQSITIAGKILPYEKLAHIETIDAEFNASGSSVLTLTIADPKLEFMSDANLYKEDLPITVWVRKWKWEYLIKFDGYIADVTLNFPEDGVPTITVTCLDITHLMNREVKRKTWSDKKLSTVIHQIAKSYGLKTRTPEFSCIIDTLTKEETITQSDATDMEFIISCLSDYEDAMTFEENGYFYFRYRDRKRDAFATLHYGEYPYDILSFSPSITRETEEDKKEKELKEKIKLAKEKEDKEKLEKKQAEREAKGYVLNQTQKLTGELRVEPKRYPVRNVLELKGLGSILSGRYFIETVKQSLDTNGLSTSLTVSKNEFG